MSTARNLGLAVLVALATPLVIGLGLVGWVTSSIPAAQGERVRGPHDLVGVQCGGTYVWVIPSATGVVLVDAGLDATAEAVRQELGSRGVKAVLLTHAHGDHVAGLAALPDVPVYTADGALLRGEREPRGWMARWFAKLTRRPVVPKDLREVTDGEELRVDGVRVRATTVPGHTDGSVAWLWEDVLFTGDAVLGGSSLALMPPELADDPKRAEESLHKLLPLDFDDLADGHVGVTGAARTALHRLARARPTEPTISLRSDGAGGDALVERTGLYVEAPAPDARGERPALVLLPDGETWRVGDAGSPERAGWNGQKVVVRGRTAGGSGGEGLKVRVESLALAPQPDAGPVLPEITRADALEANVGRWVTVRGTIRVFAPLQAGAAWGEGTLALADGASVDFSAPAGPAAGQDLAIVARVVREGQGIRVVAIPGGLSTATP